MRSFSLMPVFVSLLLLLAVHAEAAADYGKALTNSLLFFEAQRSGKLPANQRVQWRGDSGLKDGSDANVDLVGGYYDAGDNVKFGFPMAFTITTLAWGVVEFASRMQAKGELSNALAAVRWGTDYLLKASAVDGVLYGEVGDGVSDHQCWMRPEEMTTPRTTFKIDASNPGTDLAAETAAALAAASMAFKSSDSAYSAQLLERAKKLHDFARNHLGLYSDSISVAKNFYTSSGYNDEKLWAAAWLHRATGDAAYLDYLSDYEGTGGPRTMFSWDDKFLGAQILVAKLRMEGKVGNDGVWNRYKYSADVFLCNLVQKGDNNVKMSPGGTAWWGSPSNNMQYTAAALLALTSYSDYLAAAGQTLRCTNGDVSPQDLINFARSQVDYVLGANPKQTSYMVGFGSSFPQLVHHRAASMPSVKSSPGFIDCKAGYDQWYSKNSPNPNVLVGAVVGGPDQNDAYTDSRSNFNQAESATANTAPFVGVLARLA